MLLTRAIALRCSLAVQHRPEANSALVNRYGPGVFDAWWLSIVTAVTVGYGDIVPVTFSGRLLTVAWMLTGMYCVGLFAASVTTGLVAESLTDKQSSGAAMTETFAMMAGKRIGALSDVSVAVNKVGS